VRHLSGGLEQHKAAAAAAAFGRVGGGVRHASGDGSSMASPAGLMAASPAADLPGGAATYNRPASRHASGDTHLQVYCTRTT
jgi:hypothetical protein